MKVTVGTGTTLKTWYLHRGLLTKHTSFFRGALAPGHFAESLSNTVTLPAHDNESFEVFVQWLYTFDSQTTREPLEDMQFTTINLIKAYCLGDMLRAPNFKNAIMSKLYDAQLWHPSKTSLTPNCLEYGFENSLPKCPLQRLLTDACACRIVNGTIDVAKDEQWRELFEGGGDFVTEVIMKVARGSKQPWTIGNLKLHYFEPPEKESTSFGSKT